MTFLTGFAHTFTQMAWTRALMGLSEAFYIPAGLSLIADYHQGPTRSRAVGIHMAGIYAGQAFGGIGGYIADTSSWRNAFWWFGAVGVCYAMLLLAALKESRGSEGEQTVPSEKIGVVHTLKKLFGTGSFLVLVI